MFKIKLEQKERVSKREELIITLSAIGIAFVLAGIFIAFNGVNPFVALFDADFSTDQDNLLNRQMGMSTLILLQIIEGRQG